MEKLGIDSIQKVWSMRGAKTGRTRRGCHGCSLHLKELLMDEAQDEMLVEANAESYRKQQAWKVERTQWRGDDPREGCQRTRAELEQGCYLLPAGKKSMKTLHRLGTGLGLIMPKNSKHEWCAVNVVDVDNSSGTNTSSSTEEVE